MTRFLKLVTVLLVLTTQIAMADTLSYDSFKNPASMYGPSTWLHSMSGNMSKEGITKDLEAIKSVGIKGVLLFNITQRIPVADVVYGSPEHIDIMAHAAAECERLGLRYGFHNCDGWSASGGPWITPKESMKILVYRQVVTKGGKVDITLPQPTTRRGYYDDIAVLAYPANEGDIADHDTKMMEVTASDTNFDTSVITDLRADKTALLNKVGETPATVMIDYGSPKAMRSISVMTNEVRPGVKIKAKLYASDNGKDFSLVAPLQAERIGKFEYVHVANFVAVDKRYYRVEFTSSALIKDIQLSHNKLFENYLPKSALSHIDDEGLVDAAATDEYATIDSDEIIDLTDCIDADGRLRTKLPRGGWTIMRVGCTTTEVMNVPASDEGRGLECDKLSASAIEKHFGEFSQKVINASESVAPNALQYIEIDSYEMGGQNWTAKLPEEFTKRKGYDMIPYLPLLFGKCVNSNDESDAMLSDFREVCCDLATENYYHRFGELCKENGLDFYSEPYGNGPLNTIDITKGHNIPMCEFWADREILMGSDAISGAHVYGKNIISAESFSARNTWNWKGHPAMFKKSGDLAWCRGVNEFMFHRYAHQANTHVMPGMTMAGWGSHMDRTNTWWYNGGKAWFEYLTRGAYLLQQGVPVSDLLVFLGDGSPAGARTRATNYAGIKYDFTNADVLINRIKIDGNELVLPEGTRYKALKLRNCKDMKIATLRRIAEFAEAGVPLVGELPSSLWGMADITDVESREEMKRLVEQIKRAPNYYPAVDFSKHENELNITPDFRVVNSDKTIHYFHRHLEEDEGAEIYFVTNITKEYVTYDCEFRVTGKVPELWDAVSGERKTVNNWRIGEEVTSMAIDLEPEESVFVIFKEDTEEKAFNLDVRKDIIKTIDLSKNWTVEFLKFYGFGETLEFTKLIDWSQSDNEEVKYYSGTSTYHKEISIDAKTLAKSDEVILDLGNVQVIAEIFINRERVCTDWIAPFRNDILDYLQAGKNVIEVEVTNQWTNRLIGDERYPPQNDGYIASETEKMPRWYIENKPMPKGPRITFTTVPFYTKDSPLLPAGLIGPVKLEFVDQL